MHTQVDTQFTNKKGGGGGSSYNWGFQVDIYEIVLERAQREREMRRRKVR